MDYETTMEALKRLKVETGSLACSGCGKEHNCGVHGCAIIRDALEHMEAAREKVEVLDRYANQLELEQKDWQGYLMKSEQARAELGQRMADTMQKFESKLKVLESELRDERYRHDRLQDFEVAEAEELSRLKALLAAGTNVGKFRTMTDEEWADTLIRIARSGDENVALFALWCDDNGACQADQACNDDRHRDCVLRWLRSPAKEEQWASL